VLLRISATAENVRWDHAYSFLISIMLVKISCMCSLLFFVILTFLCELYFVRMPYMEATILEVMRYKTMLPFAIHSTLQDTEVGGYFVPADTMVGRYPLRW